MIENVNNSGNIKFTAGKPFGLVLQKGEVIDTTLSKVPNEETVGVAVSNVDIDAPEIAEIELVSATEIKITMSEPVTVDTSKQIQVTGYDDSGNQGQIEAKATVSSDGKTVILRPAEDDELFVTGKDSSYTLYIEAGAFVDAASNESDLIGNVDFTVLDVKDKAAPVPVKAEFINGTASDTIIITFTEDVQVSNNQPDIVVDGILYQYAGALVDGNWTASGALIIQDVAGSLGYSVAVPANAVVDDNGKANAAFTIVAE